MAKSKQKCHLLKKLQWMDIGSLNSTQLPNCQLLLGNLCESRIMKTFGKTLFLGSQELDEEYLT